MPPDYFSRSLLAATLICLGVGLVDALVEGHTDTAVIVACATALLAAYAAHQWRQRPTIPVRRDHAVWLHERAVEGEESMTAVVDRAVGAYRAGLLPEGDPGEGP